MVRSSSPTTLGWYQLILIYIGLAAIVFAVFGQTAWFDFVNYDDGSYVFENAIIRAGLTWHGVVWPFTHIHSQNWHPLTSISHMLDCEIQPKQSSSQNAQPILPGGNNPIVYRTLAATLATSGQFDVAI